MKINIENLKKIKQLNELKRYLQDIKIMSGYNVKGAKK